MSNESKRKYIGIRKTPQHICINDQFKKKSTRLPSLTSLYGVAVMIKKHSLVNICTTHLPTLLPPFSHPSRPDLMKLTIASSRGARSAMCACTPSISLSRSAAFIIGLPSQPPRYAPSVMPSAQKPSGTAVPGRANAAEVARLGGVFGRRLGAAPRRHCEAQP